MTEIEQKAQKTKNSRKKKVPEITDVSKQPETPIITETKTQVQVQEVVAPVEAPKKQKKKSAGKSNKPVIPEPIANQATSPQNATSILQSNTSVVPEESKMSIEAPVHQDQETNGQQSKNAKKKAAKKSHTPEIKIDDQVTAVKVQASTNLADDQKMAEETKKRPETKKTPKKLPKDQKTESKVDEKKVEETKEVKEKKSKKDKKKPEEPKSAQKEETPKVERVEQKPIAPVVKKTLNNQVSSDSEDESDEGSVKKSQTDYKTCISNKTKALKSTQISEIKINPKNVFLPKPNTGLQLLADESDSDSSDSDENPVQIVKKLEPKPITKPVAPITQATQKTVPQIPQKKSNANFVRFATFFSQLGWRFYSPLQPTLNFCKRILVTNT